jgi:hypothetical protein
LVAPITMHGKWEDNYDDPAHPIPSVSAIDVHGVKSDGGSDLVIVIASPLSFDERSQKRLLDKIELYLHFIRTPECQAEAGVASAENTSILIELHPDSDLRVLGLIERSKPWVAANGATLMSMPLGADSVDAL